MIGIPSTDEASAYYFSYINQVDGADLITVLSDQLDAFLLLAESISDEQSLQCYAPGKWTIREVLNHITDGERLFAFRAFWFARGFTSALPSFDQNVAVTHAEPIRVPWRRHVGEFQNVRRSTIALFENMPDEAWLRRGIASDNPFTVRALAYIVAGHFAHHLRILEERYL